MHNRKDAQTLDKDNTFLVCVQRLYDFAHVIKWTTLKGYASARIHTLNILINTNVYLGLN